MENSPPGTQIMPGGGGPGEEALSGTVGLKSGGSARSCVLYIESAPVRRAATSLIEGSLRVGCFALNPDGWWEPCGASQSTMAVAKSPRVVSGETVTRFLVKAGSCHRSHESRGG